MLSSIPLRLYIYTFIERYGLRVMLSSIYLPQLVLSNSINIFLRSRYKAL